MTYEISIRITFPEEIAGILRKEKQRYINDYGSGYKSEPHITLYLDSYTADGYPKLLEKLEQLRVKPFSISLLAPKIRIENERHRNLYVMDVSNKAALNDLYEKISEIAAPYRSPFLRKKKQKELADRGIYTDGTRKSLPTHDIPDEPFDPHITLGEIDFDKPQANITESQKNLRLIEGKEIKISGVTVFCYGKEDNAGRVTLVEEKTISFSR